MSRALTASRTIGRNGRAQLASPRATTAAPMAVVPILIPARSADLCEEPKRGVPLKHVATFMMAMALMCLLALISGRVDASRADAGLGYDGDVASRTKAASGNGYAATAAAAGSMDSDAD